MKKKYFTIRIFLSFTILSILLLISCKTSSVSNPDQAFDPSFNNIVRLSPDVEISMLDPLFWISKSKNPYERKMSLKEIALWNQNICNTFLPGSKSFHIVSDLRKIDPLLSGEEIRSGITRHNFSKSWYKKVKTKNGEEIHALSRKDWRKIYDEMNYSMLESFSYFNGGMASDSPDYKKDYPVKKAVCVRRSDMRLIPDDDFYTDDKNLWYDDIAQNSGILMGEAVLILWESKSGDWYYVKSSFCTGWVKSSDFAICNEEQWLRYFDYAEKNQTSFVTVTADRVLLSDEYIIPSSEYDLAEIPELFMGTYLFTADWKDKKFEKPFPHRIPYASYLVEVPYRKDDGKLGIAYASLPAGTCVQGLLPYNEANVLTQAFKPLGVRYGWGGMASSRDCSEYVKDIFRCFGFNFPRNSRSQLAVVGKSLSFEGKSSSAKKSLLSSLAPGTFLGFPGHVFLYLGKFNKKHYVISALGSYYPEKYNKSNKEMQDKVINANSVNINTFEVYRNSGKSWLELLSQAKLLTNDGSLIDNRIFLNPKWEFASNSKIKSGHSFLYKATSKRKNITVAVNAGHGTSGGSKVKTYSHPDKSPKITGGTTAAGSVESTAISDGMVFNDGKREADVNLRTARLLKEMLLNEGYDVLMIRDDSDTQLDNVARTVIANNNARIHIAIHYDSDFTKKDKGVFYCSIPEGLKTLPNVKKHFDESERLGKSLVEGLKNQDLPVYNDGCLQVDLTQTSYSTIPTVDIELGNQWTDTNTEELKKRAKGLLEGVELFFKK